jgi:hypothetical protein
MRAVSCHASTRDAAGRTLNADSCSAMRVTPCAAFSYSYTQTPSSGVTRGTQYMPRAAALWKHHPCRRSLIRCHHAL